MPNKSKNSQKVYFECVLQVYALIYIKIMFLPIHIHLHTFLKGQYIDPFWEPQVDINFRELFLPSKPTVKECIMWVICRDHTQIF